MRPTIAFDESGNTGQNLLDLDQPVFASASVNLKEDVACALAKPPSSQSPELHFARLRKSNPGRRRICAVVGSDELNKNTARVFLVHKPFMVSAKMVDILVETVAYADGVDLYEGGAHVGYANLLHFCGPAFCGHDPWMGVKRSFVEMIRDKTDESASTFFDSLDEACETCSHADFIEETLAPIITSRPLIPSLMENWGETELDPGVASFIALCSSWSDDYPDGYSVIHDDSKPMAYDEDFIRALMDSEARETLALPVFMTAVDYQLVDSTKHDAIQIADILASAATYWARESMSGTRDEFAERLYSSGVNDLVWGSLWPDPDFGSTDLSPLKPLSAEDITRLGREISKRIYRDESGRPRRRS